MSQTTDNRTQALNYCYHCPSLCRSSCPVAEADRRESSTPRAKMTALRLLLGHKLPWNAENALPAYNCSDCGQATEHCELDNPVAPTLNEFRALAFRKGHAPTSIYRFCEKFKKRNNPYGVHLGPRLKKRLSSERFKPHAVTYFPGCTEIYRSPETIQHTLELLTKLGLPDVAVFDKPMQCCGYPLLAAGDLKGFREHAEVMSHLLADYPLIVSGAPACLFTLKEYYPAHGFSLGTELVHITEFLEPQLAQTNVHIKNRVATSIAYHDPCYLSRYLGATAAPRRLLEMVCGEVLREFRRNREESYCCGGGGLLPITHSETAEQMVGNRLEEFRETGASILVSACPTCVHRFKKFGDKVNVRGLVEFLNRAIEIEGERSAETL